MTDYGRTSYIWPGWNTTSKGETLHAKEILGSLHTLHCCLFLATRTEAVMVMPFNVEELAKRAEKVFVGTCTKVSHRVNEQGVPVVEVTFAVAEAVKGEVGTTVTFQQIDPHRQQPSHPHPP